jgi:hypothetical protein
VSGVSASRRGVGAGERPSHAHAFVRAQLSRSQPISADLSRSQPISSAPAEDKSILYTCCALLLQIHACGSSDCNQIAIRWQSDSNQIAIHACGSSDSNQIAIRGHARQIHASFRLQSEAISGHQRPSEATKVHPWPSGAAYHLLLVAQSRLVQEGLAACEPRTQGRRESAHGPIAAEEQPFGREMGQAVEHLMREAIKRRSERRSERLRERYAEQCGTQ